MVQEMPGGEKLVGFTRILHRTQPDVLMTTNEVSTLPLWERVHVSIILERDMKEHNDERMGALHLNTDSRHG